MSINLKDLGLLLGEYNSLTNRTRLTKQDEQRCAYLQTAIAAVKSGVSLREVDVHFFNERSRAAGLPEVRLDNPSAVEKEARGYQAFFNGETRDMTEGAASIKNQIGTYTGLGYFVPTDFFGSLFAAMKKADALFDDASVTLIKSTNGRPLPVPTAGDTENTASVVTEAGSQTSVDIDATGHVTLGAYSYASDRYVVSQEAFQDVDGAITIVGLMKKFFADKIARGIGRDLVSGNGIGKTKGLVPSIEAIGSPMVTAQGSSVNDGGAGTGANSLGSVDLSAALNAIDAAYLNANTAWLMNQKTLVTLSGQIDKYGNILDLVEYDNGVATIFGIRVAICPSLDSIGASNVPVVLGDLSYWATRLVTDDSSGIKVYTEAPGLVENGNIGIRCFVRADGALLYTDSASPSPFVYIRNHS